MAGQGFTKARGCIETRGVAFRVRPRETNGLKWCRTCGYRIDLHEKVLRDDGDPRATLTSWSSRREAAADRRE